MADFCHFSPSAGEGSGGQSLQLGGANDPLGVATAKYAKLSTNVEKRNLKCEIMASQSWLIILWKHVNVYSF